MNQKRKYDSTVARIAGNIMAGLVGRGGTVDGTNGRWNVATSVALARAIVAEVERTEPADADARKGER